MFTDGNDRQYEKTMKEVPNFKQRSSGSRSAQFKYKYQDFDCRCCDEYKACPKDCLCPYILDNLPDLYDDPEFIDAIENAESCKTAKRLTLLYLRQEGAVCG